MIAYKNNLVHMQERKRGYVEALKDNELLTKNSLVREINFNTIKEDIDTSLRDLLSPKNKIDAIFFATNTLAMHGLKYLVKQNYKIPDNVEVVCFDESEAFDFFNFPLAFVSQPLEKVAKEAVQILVNHISVKKRKTSEVLVRSTFVVKKGLFNS